MEINYGYLLLDFIITIIAYLFLPFIIFYKKNDRYDIKERKKIIVFNSIVISGCFILYRVINDYENAMISFAPAIFYYYVNRWIWCKKTDIIPNSKIKNNNRNTFFITSLAIALFLSIVVNVFQLINSFKNKDCYCETIQNDETKDIAFLNKYVAIVPENQDFYLSYYMWKNSIYKNQNFYLMSITDAKNSGYSDKYFESPMPYEKYKELYFGN